MILLTPHPTVHGSIPRTSQVGQRCIRLHGKATPIEPASLPTSSPAAMRHAAPTYWFRRGGALMWHSRTPPQNGRTPLFIAASQGRADVVQVLIREQRSKKWRLFCKQHCDAQGVSPLPIALRPVRRATAAVRARIRCTGFIRPSARTCNGVVQRPHSRDRRQHTRQSRRTHSCAAHPRRKCRARFHRSARPSGGGGGGGGRGGVGRVGNCRGPRFTPRREGGTWRRWPAMVRIPPPPPPAQRPQPTVAQPNRRRMRLTRISPATEISLGCLLCHHVCSRNSLPFSLSPSLAPYSHPLSPLCPGVG
jgi:hypothetical protein